MKTKTLNKPTLLFKKVVHKNNIRLLVLFPYNETIISKIRNLEVFSWSKTLRGWHAPFDKDLIHLIQETFNDLVAFKFDKNLYETLKVKSPKSTRVLSTGQRQFLNDFVKYLRGKFYSKSTITTYSNFIADFIEFINSKPLNELSNRDVERFIEDVMVPKRLSSSTHRQFISAVKIFIQFYPESAIEDVKLIRPKKSKLLPSVLSQEEVIDILRCTKNLKHRSILALIYSTGLRIGELLNLELVHINIDRQQIIVKMAKGRKDRYVVIAESFFTSFTKLCSYISTKTFFC